MSDLDILYEYLLSDDISLYENEIFEIIPELKYEKNFDQKSKWHSFDVWNHTVAVVNSCDKNKEDRLVLLLHDIGKPFSFQDNGKIRHFKNHALKSSFIAKDILERLKVPSINSQIILKLILMHSTKINIEDINEENIDFYKRLLKIKKCDANGYEAEHSKIIIDDLNLFERKLITKKINWLR